MTEIKGNFGNPGQGNGNQIPTEAPDFSLEGFETLARVVSIYDGDSFHSVFKFNNRFYDWNCRLDGVDTPELRGKTEIEKEYARKARDKFREMALGKVVNLKCGKSDKYGRILTKVEITSGNKNDSSGIGDDSIDIASELIKLGLGREYHGGKKEEWGFPIENTGKETETDTPDLQKTTGP